MFKHLILPLIIAGIGIFPIYFALLFAADTLWGSRQILSWIAYESQHAFLYQETRDIVGSLTVALPIVWVTGGLALTANARYRLPITLLLPVFLALVLILFGFRFDQGVLFATALLIATLSAIFASRVFRHA